MDKKTKTLALVGLGVGGVGLAYVLSKNKGASSGDGATSPAQPVSVPIPALLAQSSQRPASVGGSSPIPSNVQPAPPTTATGSLQDFYTKAGLRPYTANDPHYDAYKGNYDKLLNLGNDSFLTVPTYVTDKASLLKHLSIVQSQYSGGDAAYANTLGAKIEQINAL